MPPAIIWRGNTGLVPQWSGADLQIADRITDTDVYRGPFWLCRWSALLRGTYGTGLRLGWVVTNSKVQSERKGIGLLTITWEPGGPWGNQRYLPLDDFRCESVELYPKVERNKNMRDPATGSAIDPIVIALCYDAVHGDAVKKTSARNAVYNLHARTSTPPAHSSWAEQEDYGIVLLDWLDHGNETYYEAGIKYSYIWHSFVWPSMSMGGVIEPFPTGGPMMGDASFSWLRLADTPDPAGVNGSVYKITSTWLGGSMGHWDPILYSP